MLYYDNIMVSYIPNLYLFYFLGIIITNLF